MSDIPTRPKSAPTTTSKALAQKPIARDLDAILKRLNKLNPGKRSSATNAIKAMFQFVEPISDEAANTILENLRKRGSLTIDPDEKIHFRRA